MVPFMYCLAIIMLMFGVLTAQMPMETTGWTQPATFFYSLPFAIAAALCGGWAWTNDTPDKWTTGE